MSNKKHYNKNYANNRQKPIVKKKSSDQNKTKEPLVSFSQIPFALIILAYIFIVTFTPNLMALDTNAPKFLSLALVNALAFILLYTNKSIRQEPGSLMRFFNTKIGLIYSGFLIFCIISFTQSVNLKESVLNFTKIFSVFSAAFILSNILMRNMRFIQLIAIVVTGILIFDSLSVFYYISEFIDRSIASIQDIKSVYSNKNILASALFAKIPFALWLFVYGKGWQKRLGWFAMFIGITATFFMAARAFYVGLTIITVIFTAYSLINYFRDRQKSHLWVLGGYAGALVLGLVLFTLTQQNLYPSSSSRHTKGITEQISTINTDDGSTQVRLNAWKYSIYLIKENPLLGVGLGNWKIRVLEHENKVNKGFIYLYKSHNDFLENTAETGIIGGILYLGLYILIGWTFLTAFFHRRKTEALYKYLFLSASGMVFFSFDAAFNFPHDRPEMMILFALYIAIGISSSYYLNRVSNSIASEEQGDEIQKNTLRSEAILSGSTEDSFSHLQHSPQTRLMHIGVSVLLVFMLSLAYIFYLNFESSKLQRVVYQEIMTGKLKSPSSMFVNSFPYIPNVSIWGEAISVITARYLINDSKNREAIELLLPDKSNPFDARREYFLAMAFNNLKEPDSALIYSKHAYDLKPNYFRNLHLMLTLMEEKKMDIEIPPYFDKYLETNKTDKNAWVYATGFYNKTEEIDKAYEMIQEALNYLPNDSLIMQQQRYLYYRKFVEPNKEFYTKAMDLYNSKKYNEAVKAFDEYLIVVPDDKNAYRMRAFSYYFLKKHEKSIEEINAYFATYEKEGSLMNLRGVCLRELGEPDKACADFLEAMKMGDASGKTNYDAFCKKK